MRILKVFLAFVLAFAKAFWCGKWRSLFRRFDRFEWAIKIDREPRDASNWSRCLKKATNCQFELVGVTNFVAQRGSEHEQSSEHFECYIWAGWFSRSSPSCEWWLFQDHSEPLKLWNLESEFQTLQSTNCLFRVSTKSQPNTSVQSSKTFKHPVDAIVKSSAKCTRFVHNGLLSNGRRSFNKDWN